MNRTVPNNKKIQRLYNQFYDKILIHLNDNGFSVEMYDHHFVSKKTSAFLFKNQEDGSVLIGKQEANRYVCDGYNPKVGKMVALLKLLNNGDWVGAVEKLEKGDDPLCWNT